jgi:hypothetical protein
VFAASVGPLVGAGISLWVDSPVYGLYWNQYALLVTDASGHFSATGLENDAPLIIKILDDAYRQPCASRVDADAGESVRVEIVPVTDFDAIDPPRPSAAGDPSLTGAVYESTPGGRKPVSGVQVSVQFRYWNDVALPIATALTGRDGRYYLCNLPQEVVVVADKQGYVPTTIRPVDTTSGVPLDIELRQPDDI